MTRVLSILALLAGLIGIGLGIAGNTAWKPPASYHATADVSEPGSALVLRPGTLYTGGEEGSVVISGAEPGQELTLVTGHPEDISGWLGGATYTEVTGLTDWETVETTTVNPGSEEVLPAAGSSDVWWSAETVTAPLQWDVAEMRAGEPTEGDLLTYVLIAPEGQQAPGSIEMTWPTDLVNDWVPTALWGGTALIVLGVVLLAVDTALRSRRRARSEDESALDDLMGTDKDAERAVETGAEPTEENR